MSALGGNGRATDHTVRLPSTGERSSWTQESVFDPWLKLHRSGHLALFCKTNPNDGRDQNRETSFSNWKLHISDWRGPGEKTRFYETNPNGEIQAL